MARIIIRGVVQGVGFRPAVYRLAKEMGLCGHVKNTGSNVEIHIDGDAEVFISALVRALPPLARIDGVMVSDSPAPNTEFEIIPSSTGQRSSPLPPDAAMCDDCLEELSNNTDHRHDFPFINCTNCGARFSVIYDLPYDRPKTSMDDFPVCERCAGEYDDPLDRRFHAQTISCPDCGPRFRLEGLSAPDPISEFAKQLDSGIIGAIKSWGGTHVVCIPSQVEHLRDRFNRSQKPLAVMVKDIEAAKKHAQVTWHEEELLASSARPIVLLDKKGDELDATAPGLDKVGLYLPYNGLHHMLFGRLEHDALIMTSGNIPGEPMAVTDEEIMKLAADIFLIHDRRIINRTDDSVVLPCSDGHYFLRKSRGYVPEEVPIPHGKTLVAVGGDMNCTGAVSINGKAILTQHIGDINRYETAGFLESAVKHLMALYGVERPEAIVTDMHPRYSSRGVGKRLAEEFGIRTIEVQHHAAHAYALMAEHDLDHLMVLSCDGTGYGADGMIWGGEVLDVSRRGYERVGHLEYVPLLGGDKAVEDPRRVVFAIASLLGLDQPYFTGAELKILDSMMDKSVGTSSTGRVLDALSCWLGVCERMTYDGEPAMKLEPYMRKGNPTYDLQAPVNTGVVGTLELFRQLAEITKPGDELRQGDIADISRSFADALFQGLVDAAGPTESLGFTGGVSYNLVINDILQQKLDAVGAKLITHVRVPNGDGGISYGQLVGGGLDVSGNTG